ncbi:hypothetical protein GW17_00057564 [Ensete ventricosum]|nr:hypothetical protein GW17_00057564 [Ensete ventricosum]
MVKSMHRVDAVGNSLGVHWEFAEGIGSLLGWRKGVCQKKIETYRKIVGGSRKACQDQDQWDLVEGIGKLIEGIGKLVGNTSGDRRKKTGWLVARMSEVIGLAKVGS